MKQAFEHSRGDAKCIYVSFKDITHKSYFLKFIV